MRTVIGLGGHGFRQDKPYIMSCREICTHRAVICSAVCGQGVKERVTQRIAHRTFSRQIRLRRRVGVEFEFDEKSQLVDNKY